MSINSLSMASSLSCIGSAYDLEYLRIIRELRAYGIEPCGDKDADKLKLQKVKAANQSVEKEISMPKENKSKTPETEKDNMNSDKGVGAEQVAILNRLKLGLL